MKIDCIAIDDEPLALDIIKDYALKVPFLNLIQTFDNALESLDFLKQQRVDLLFLDIQMDDLTGIQLLNVIKQKPLVIFTTAYDKFAIQGYELDALDYLLKPISFERFLRAVDKAYDRLASRHENSMDNSPAKPANTANDDYIFVKTEFHLEKVRFSDILFIEGMGDYLLIQTPTSKIMTLQNFRKIEEVLPDGRFERVHKSYIVALDKIDRIERNRIYINQKIIPISDTYRKTFFDALDGKRLE
ncbi:MAG TPA: LytTR family DNA-binding domain-containing protein [Bacteroidales bacterium]|nr:LytTR family DNA-binding domain-containing protein [Bacteroidales bacterium]